MDGFLILAGAWFSFGAAGAALAYRGSMRRYGKNIYGRAGLLGTLVLGFSGFVGSVVAW